MKRLKSKAARFVIYATIFFMGLTLGTAFTGTNRTMAAGSDIKIYLNNKQLIFGENPNDPEPYIKNGRTLVPFRKIFEALGMEITWQANTRTVIAKNEAVNMELYIGKDYAFVNNFKKQLDVTPEITDGRTFVPLRFVSESYGAEVIWEPDTRSIYINYAQGKYKLGEEAVYKDLKFTVDSLDKRIDEDCIIVKGKTSRNDIPLIIELQDSSKRFYSREVNVSVNIVPQTGKYEYTVKVYVKDDFIPVNIYVKTYNEGVEPFKIANYVY